MMRKLFISFWLCLFAFSAFPQNILLISSRKVPFFAKVVDGVKDYISENIATASTDVVYSDDGDILNKAVSKKYDVICALGVSDAKKIISHVKDIPVVFTLVIDPVKNGLVDSLAPSGKNITGVTLAFPVASELEMVRKVMPGIKTIGMLYGGASEDVYNGLKQLDVRVKGVKVSGATQVPSAISEFNHGDVDAVWLVMDTEVYDKDSLSFTLNHCSERKIPVIGFASNTVKAGALMGFVYDYNDLGRQTGEVVGSIIKGKNAGEIPIAPPRKVGYSINKRIANYMGIDIPSAITGSAVETFE